MKRSKLRNIINRAREISTKKDSPFESFKKSLPMDINDNYRLEAAWKAYGLPSNFQEAKFYGMIESLDGENYLLPSIGYNEDTEEYEYLNKGKENETVAKDIRAWDNDVIPFIKELKLGGFIRIYDKDKDCWKYSKNKSQETLTALEEVVNSFLKGGKTKNKESYYEFLKTLPPNLQKGNTDDGDGVEKDDGYRMELLFQNAPDVWTFEDGVKKGYFNLNEEDGLYHSGSIIKMPNGNYEFLKSSNHPTVGYETNWYKYHPSAKEFRQNYELVTTDDNGNPLKYYKYIKRTPQAFKQGGKSEYKKVKSDKAYYDKDSDTVYYTNDEDLIHEGFHARPDYVLLEQLKPYYENLNDEKILNFGGNLEFVKRLEGDPGHFYSPEELGARISAAKFRTKGNNYTPEFFKYLRTNENLYGDNMRDLLYMYNDENLSKIFNLGDTQAFKQGGQMNVIPEGALHARKNNMELAEKGEITHKGVPVIDNDGNQQAEIEREEIIFNKEVTEKLEKWYKEFKSDESSSAEKDKLAIEAGKLLAKEIIENTDDRTGLIDNVKDKL